MASELQAHRGIYAHVVRADKQNFLWHSKKSTRINTTDQTWLYAQLYSSTEHPNITVGLFKKID